MKYQISVNDFEDFWTNGTDLPGRKPTAAVRCQTASTGRKGRFCLRVKFVEEMDRIFPGQVLQVATDLSKSVRFLSTTMSHGDPDPKKWFMLMHVEPINCELTDLSDVYLVGFASRDY